MPGEALTSPGEKPPLKPKTCNQAESIYPWRGLSLGLNSATSTSEVVAWVGVDTLRSHETAPAAMVRWEPTSCSLPGVGMASMGTEEDRCSAGEGRMDLPHFLTLPS